MVQSDRSPVGGLASVLLAVGFVAAVLASLSLGAVPLSLHEIVGGLRGTGDGTIVTIIRELRVPRTLLGIGIGVALGISGTSLQSTLRNALAEPYLLGVSGGAAVGAVFAYAAGVVHPGVLALAAFGGALLAILAVLVLGRDQTGARPPAQLLVAGVVIGAFSNAAIMVVLATTSDTARRGALWWMMGSLAAARWEEVAWLAVVVPALGAGLLYLGRALDVLTLGADASRALGLDADRVARRAFILSSLLAAATVATAGLIGFVGLMVPHIARRLVGTVATRTTMMVAAIAGATLVLFADVVARVARAPSELPLGAVTALLGVPFFLWQLRRQS